jgi:hypothetical protein
MRTEFAIVIDIEERSDGMMSGTASIQASRADMDALIFATEHMMNLVALESDAGYDRAIELLVEGAKKAHRVQ